jgi:transcriptional regulator with XRE-family HTH domain
MQKSPRGARKSPLDHDPAALRYALDKSGLSQVELAAAINRSEGLVSELLRGTRNAHPALLLKIAHALNCPVVVIEAKRQIFGAA